MQYHLSKHIHTVTFFSILKHTCLSVDDKEVELTKLEFDLLRTMIENKMLF